MPAAAIPAAFPAALPATDPRLALLGGMDADAAAYLAANGIAAGLPATCVNDAFRLLKANGLLPDDVVFLRPSQCSTTTPKTSAGETVTFFNSPTFGQNGLVFNGLNAAWFPCAIGTGAFTVVFEMRANREGTAFGFPAVAITNSLGHSKASNQLAWGNGLAARVATYEVVGPLSSQTLYTSEGALDTVDSPSTLDPYSEFDVVAAFSSDNAASPRIRIYNEAILEIEDATGNIQISSGLGRINIAGLYTSGVTYGAKSKMACASIAVFKRELTPAEVVIVTRALRLSDPRQAVLLPWGDSLSTNIWTPARVEMNWPCRFTERRDWAKWLRVYCEGQGGRQSAWGVSNYATSVTPVVDVLGRREAWATVLFGTNDIYVGGRTNSAIVNDILTSVEALQADGFKVLLMTIPPGKAGAYTAPQETQRQAVNALLTAAAATADAFLDLADIDAIADLEAWAFYDGYHFTSAGNQLIAERVAEKTVYSTVAMPRVTARPTLSGTTTLTATTGTWANSPSSYAYQWLRDGAEISGETNATYSPGAGDTGTRLACRVTATNSLGAMTATSDLTAEIT